MEHASYKYYAFISYSRKNSRAAAFLHRKLENFRIPSKYVSAENQPENKKYLRPIFRDRRDLEASENNFTEHIKSAVATSRYLIVLCSPEAAQSVWVNEEVKYFLETHENDYQSIVPVILAGEPGCGGESECLVPFLQVSTITMRNLPSMIPDVGDSQKNGWENGVIQTLSYMLKVNREKIKNFADSIKIRKARIYALTGLIMAGVFACLTLWAVMAEAKAKQQAEIAQKTRDFMRDMFDAANPDKKGGNPKLTVLESIRNKLPAIETLTPWQLKAAVAADMGAVFKSVGEFEQALKLLQVAHELNIMHRSESLEAAATYSYIGEIYCAVARYDEAIEYHKKALGCRLLALGNMHSDVAKSYRNLGEAYMELAHYETAMEYFDNALKIELELHGENHEDVAVSYNYIGNVFYNAKDQPDKAAEYYRKALDINKKVFGEAHSRVAASYNNMGNVFARKGEYAQALENYQKSLAINLELLDSKHPIIAVNYNNIGIVYSLQYNTDEALKYFEKSLKINVGVYGENHPGTAVSYCLLSDVYLQEQKFDQALEYSEKSLKIYQEYFAGNHPLLATVYRSIGLIYQEKRDYDKALEYYEKSLKINLEVFGERHSYIAYNYFSIGRVYLDKSLQDQALEYFEKALSILREIGGDDSSDVLRMKDVIDALQNSASGNNDTASEVPQAPASSESNSEGNEFKNLIEEIQQQLDPDYRGARTNAPARTATARSTSNGRSGSNSNAATSVADDIDNVITRRNNSGRRSNDSVVPVSGGDSVHPTTPPAPRPDSERRRRLVNEIEQAM